MIDRFDNIVPPGFAKAKEAIDAMVKTVERLDGNWIVRIDPHSGTCHGAHDIIVHIVPCYPQDATTAADPRTEWHFSISWQASGFLSAHGTLTFAIGLSYACGLIERMKTDMAKGIPISDLLRHEGGTL